MRRFPLWSVVSIAIAGTARRIAEVAVALISPPTIWRAVPVPARARAGISMRRDRAI